VLWTARGLKPVCSGRSSSWRPLGTDATSLAGVDVQLAAEAASNIALVTRVSALMPIRVHPYIAVSHLMSTLGARHSASSAVCRTCALRRLRSHFDLPLMSHASAHSLPMIHGQLGLRQVRQESFDAQRDHVQSRLCVGRNLARHAPFGLVTKIRGGR